jgi:hypothetical protein
MIHGRKNARRPWRSEEDKQLREMVEARKSLTMVALRLKRTEMAVRQRLHLLKSHFRDDRKEPLA